MEIPELDDLTGAKKGVRKGSILNQSPQGAGLINGQAMAFKFRTETSDDMLDDEWDVLLPNPEEYDEEEEIIGERKEEKKEETKVDRREVREKIREGVSEEDEHEDEDEDEDGDYTG